MPIRRHYEDIKNLLSVNLLCGFFLSAECNRWRIEWAAAYILNRCETEQDQLVVKH